MKKGRRATANQGMPSTTRRPRRVLVTFATADFYASQQLLVESARPFVDGYVWYREHDLPWSFRRRNARSFKEGRGFGYFVWKPWVILDALRALEPGDLVLYVDSGNLIVNDPAPLFEKCVGSEKGIVVFDNRDWCPDGKVWKNSMFTRGDCFARLDATGPEYVNGDQVNASYLVAQKRDSAVAFLKEFLRACEDHQIVSDAPNVLRENEPDFVDHRHDQSVLSILAIRDGIETQRDPSQFGNQAIPLKAGDFPQIFDHHRQRSTREAGSERRARRGRRRAALRRLAGVRKRVTWFELSSRPCMLTQCDGNDHP